MTLYRKIKIFPYQVSIKHAPQNFSRSETLSLLLLIHTLVKKRPLLLVPKITVCMSQKNSIFWTELSKLRILTKKFVKKLPTFVLSKYFWAFFCNFQRFWKICVGVLCSESFQPKNPDPQHSNVYKHFPTFLPNNHAVKFAFVPDFCFFDLHCSCMSTLEGSNIVKFYQKKFRSLRVLSQAFPYQFFVVGKSIFNLHTCSNFSTESSQCASSWFFPAYKP